MRTLLGLLVAIASFPKARSRSHCSYCGNIPSSDSCIVPVLNSLFSDHTYYNQIQLDPFPSCHIPLSLSSPNANYTASFTSDGNFLVRGTTTLWSSDTNDESDPGQMLMVMTSGQLVVWSYYADPYIMAGTPNTNSPFCLTLKNDGHMYMYDTSCNILWKS